jgi:3'(2'), 5'-bisphosphate nucleotidase
MKIYQDLRDEVAGSNGVLVMLKGDNSPLTRADLQAHQIISCRLASLAPGVPVVSEEDSQSMGYRLPMGDFWLIDPLDGTKEFLAQNGEFTVNIAWSGTARRSPAVVAPALGQAYWGGEGSRHSVKLAAGGNRSR